MHKIRRLSLVRFFVSFLMHLTPILQGCRTPRGKVVGHICLYAYMICTRSIQIYFSIFFNFILVSH